MEIECSAAQTLERAVTWQEIRAIVESWDKGKKYYGVPRGGQYIAALLNPADTPEQADVICDDLIDSGATMQAWKNRFPEKPFMAVFDKRTNGAGWIRFPWEQAGDIDIQENVKRVLQYFDDPAREGLSQTPKRYISFLKEFLQPQTFNFTAFNSEGMDEMIVQTNIPFYSLCEHHMVPFFGVAHVAYIPNGKIVGLSKLARTVDLYSRSLQNQERITQQIAQRIEKELQPLGVGVVLTAKHLCMEMRGVKKHDTWTTTSKMVGFFKTDLNCRQEFLGLIKHRPQ